MSSKIIKKICMLGDGGVGKISLIKKFVFDKYDDDYISTLGTKITKKVIDYKEKDADLTLMIWDVMGQKGYERIHKTAFDSATGMLMVCDLTRKDTFDNIDYWLHKIVDIAGKVPFIILGNKNDLSEKQVTEDDLQQLSKKYNMPYYLTSAKTGENVEKGFRTLGSLILDSKVPTIPNNIQKKEIKIDKIHEIQDEIISEFCNLMGGADIGMNIIRKQYSQIDVDFRNVNRENLLQVSDRLTNIINDFKTEEEVKNAKQTFRKIINKYTE